ncbi:MAG: hypothetical protein FJ271_30255 [Planctomycetes bacterium]|nr:hypothetical protein [Armatimonadota bacterium]MBM4073172.1 hypothetical protein [Planctomycetota bacterium]
MQVTSSMPQPEARKQFATTLEGCAQADGSAGDVEPRDGYVETHNSDGTVSRAMFARAADGSDRFKYIMEQRDAGGNPIRMEFTDASHPAW